MIKNPKFFASVQGVDIWEQVKEYVDSKYTPIRITLHGDGASWIKRGCIFFRGIEFYLDRYHVCQAVTRLTANNREKRERIMESIVEGDRSYIEDLYWKRFNKKYTGVKSEDKRQSLEYLLNNFDNIDFQNQALRCSAEGHVSNVLSKRMSSRPMAWSIPGAHRIASFRAFQYNNGDFIKLTTQKKRETKVSSPAPGLTRELGAYNSLRDKPRYNVPILQGKTNSLYTAIKGLLYNN